MNLKQRDLHLRQHFKDQHDNPPKGFNPDAMPKEFWDEHARLYEPFFTNPKLSREERKKHYKEIFDKLEKSGKYKTARERGDMYNMKEENNIKNKIDDVLAKKDTPKKEASDKPSVWTPFAKKIYADMEIYFDKLKGSSPTRAAAEFYRKEIDNKLEDGKEKDGMIKFYNKRFKLPGITAQAYNYFAETVINPNGDVIADAALYKTIKGIIESTTEADEDDIKTATKKIVEFIKGMNKPKESAVNERKS